MVLALQGLAGKLRLQNIDGPQSRRKLHWLGQHSDDAIIDGLSTTSVRPILFATSAVNAGVRLFAQSLPHQSAKIQEGVLEQVSTLLAPSTAQQSPGRYAALTTNVSVALLLALQPGGKDGGLGVGTLRGTESEKAIQELLHVSCHHPYIDISLIVAGHACSIPDQSIRHLAAEALGPSLEPSTRSGCTMALGFIHAELGGHGCRAVPEASPWRSHFSWPVIRTPMVSFFWALDSLSKLADTAGLAFSSSVLRAHWSACAAVYDGVSWKRMPLGTLLKF
ncbi:hypothetical protein MRB53_039614 [Persea americana]|nr:hypothetical protein MRB53_039614 [Persea americana]